MKVTYSPSDKFHKPTEERGMGVKYGVAKRAGYKGRWYLLLLLVVAPVILVGWIFLRPHVFVLASGIITTEPLEVRAPGTGSVSTIAVTAGDTLLRDSVILLIANPQLDAQIAELERQLVELGSEERSLDPAILTQLQARIDVANEGVIRQGSLLRRYEEFQSRGVVPTSDMAMVLQAHTAARMALEQARADLIQVRQRQQMEFNAGAVAQSRHSLNLQLARLNAQRAQLQIKAPMNTRAVDVLVQPGEHIAEGRPLALLAGREHSVVQAYLEPKYLDYTEIGQGATVILPNGDRFKANISEPTELVGRLPIQLSGPFDGEKPVLRITLQPEVTLPVSIEGVPVEVSFDHDWSWANRTAEAVQINVGQAWSWIYRMTAELWQTR